MSKLRKQGFLNARYSTELLDRLGLAACLESRKRHVEIDEGPLSREYVTRGSDETINAATPEELEVAKADLAERRRRAAVLKRLRKAKRARHERAEKDRRQQPRRATDPAPIARTA